MKLWAAEAEPRCQGAIGKGHLCERSVDLRPPSMEARWPPSGVGQLGQEQLDALSEKLTRLAEQERAVSRRMACRSPSRSTVPRPPLGFNSSGFQVLNDPKAKRRNASVEDFCPAALLCVVLGLRPPLDGLDSGRNLVAGPGNANLYMHRRGQSKCNAIGLEGLGMLWLEWTECSEAVMSCKPRRSETVEACRRAA